jgi:hypothetical protein
MGYFNFGDGQYDTERGAQVTGKEWLDHLPDLLKLGGDPSNPTTFGGQLAQAMSGAATELGLSPDDLKGELSKMVGNELGDFWAFGVIPPWMNVNGGFGKGVMGGWKSPFIQRALSYGKDGGMWNAVLNFWKQGASTVAAGIPVVGGAASSGIKAVPVNTKENKYGS